MNRISVFSSRLMLRWNNILDRNTSALQSIKYSSKSSNSDEAKPIDNKVAQEKKSKEALKKLGDLLKQMVDEEVVASKSKINLAKPKDNKYFENKKNDKRERFVPPEKQMTAAAKDVAELLGGDVKQTESELLQKLLTTSDKQSPSSLNDIVKGLKIDQQSNELEHSRAEQVKQILKNVKTSLPRRQPKKSGPELVSEKIDLFGSEPLGIFTKSQGATTEGIENETWNRLYRRELRLAITQPPANYFQQMIQWTDQGKIWKFPIDNEEGMEEEHNVYFTEHVFLEKHLEPWCPPKGPLRHFMELVCVGLSKNPYLTVEMKKEHIDWFRKYFEDKKQLLTDVGALHNHNLGNVGPKQVESKKN